MSNRIDSVEKFIAWTKRLEGGLLIFRGLADATWEVSASAYRRIKTSQDEAPSPFVFQNSMKQLLNNASLRGFREHQGKSLSDLELLASLQHNGAATCLIDFTNNSLVALWFACQENTESTGKVVAMPTDKIEHFSTVSYQDLKKSIDEFLYKDKLWKWEPSHLSNRIVAQQSIFVFGQGKIDTEHYEEVIIEGANKLEIRNELQEKFGISEQHLFSDFTGFALSNAHDKPYTGYTADDYLNSGMEFHQRGDLKKAIDDYDQAIECNPRFFKAYNNRGVARDDRGDHKRAIADYDKAIEINPQADGVYSNRGNAKRKTGDYQGAIVDYDKAVEINPQYAEAYYNRGVAKNELGNHQGAIVDYDKAVEINPQYAHAYNNRGIAKRALGDHHGAIADFDKAIGINPQHIMAYNNRGITNAALGDYQGAIADYDKAIEFSPRYGEAHCNRGIAKHNSGDYE